MNKEKEEHCHYSGLPSPSAYARDNTDYDGMGNQGRVPINNKDKKDWWIISISFIIGIIAILLILSIIP